MSQLITNRDFGLDVVRVTAIAMIVLMHSPMPGSAPGFLLSGLGYVTAAGVGLLFMVSGALLLGEDMPCGQFLRRRFSKVLWPTLFWTCIYLLANWAMNAVTVADAARMLLSIPFSAQGHGVMWFMYTLAGLYLLTPILSRWLKGATQREVELYLLLWAVSLVYPYLDLFGIAINESNTGILYYFTGYAGYFLLGYYLKTWGCKLHKSFLLICVAVALIVPALILPIWHQVDFYRVLWYLSLPVAAMCVIWFLCLNGIQFNREPQLLTQISRLTFGVYLSHILIMRGVLWKLPLIDAIPGIPRIAVMAIVTFLLALLLSWLVSKLPKRLSRVIIGI